MDLTTLLMIIRRRWYVAAPLFALGVLGGALVGGSPTYTVEANFLLVAPVVSSDGTVSNALLENSSGVNAVASVAVVVLESEASRRDVDAAGFSAEYDFRIARNEPFVTLVVDADDGDLAVGSTLALSRLFIEEIADQQLRFGVASGSLVRAELLDVDEPEADYSGVRLRQAVALVAGLVAAVVAAVALEGWRYWRGRGAGGVDGTGPVGDDTLVAGSDDPDGVGTAGADDGDDVGAVGTGGTDTHREVMPVSGWRRRGVRVPDDGEPDGVDLDDADT